MKTSVSTYSFLPLREKGMSLTQCAEKVKEMGFDAIEITTLPSQCDREYEARTMRDVCERLNLPVANYTVSADFLNIKDGGSLSDEIERIKKEIDIAEILGAPGLRHDAATWGYRKNQHGFRGFDNVLPILAEGCRAVTEYAAEKNIKTMVENHGYFAQDSDRVEKLVNTVARDNFGLLVDMGNFLCVDESPVEAVSRTAPYAFHVHAKDFHIKSGSGPSPGGGFFPSRGGNFLRGAIIGHGEVPVKQCLRILKAAGYDGYISIEFEGMEDTLAALSIGLDNLKRYIWELEA